MSIHLMLAYLMAHRTSPVGGQEYI